MEQKTVAQGLADLLSGWGVKFVFGTAGDTILHFLSCLSQHPVRFIQMRNEESAAYAASAYAKLTGELGVVAADGGPGTGRLVNGLADALNDGAPVFAVTGQVESLYLGTDHKQYINQQLLLRSVTIRSENLGSPQSLTAAAAQLLRTAVSQGGPVHLSVPKDFWQQPTDPAPVKNEPFLTQKPRAEQTVISQAVEWLRNARRPMILAGRGASRAVTEVLTLADKLGAGVVYTLPMVGIMPDHPLVVRGLGEGGSEAAAELLRECDCLVRLGATYWPSSLTSDDKKVLSVDTCPGNISRGIPADFGLVGDVRTVLAYLLTGMEEIGTDGSWTRHVQDEASAWQRRLEQELAEASSDHPSRAVRTLAEHAEENAVICLDVGEHVLWFSRFFQGRGQRVLVSGRWRGMGFSLGASIAAKLADPKAHVIAIVGDGGFSMLMGEFSSAVEMQLPIIFLLMNNRSYAMEANAAASAGIQPVGVFLRDIRFDEVARACGGIGHRISPAELPDVLEREKHATRPVLIDLQVAPAPMPTAKL